VFVFSSTSSICINTNSNLRLYHRHINFEYRDYSMLVYSLTPSGFLHRQRPAHRPPMCRQWCNRRIVRSAIWSTPQSKPHPRSFRFFINGIRQRLTHLAKITSTRRTPRPMMIAPVIHTGIRPTTSPPKPLGPIIIELFLIAIELLLELFFHLVRFVLDYMAPSRLFLRATPCDEL